MTIFRLFAAAGSYLMFADHSMALAGSAVDTLQGIADGNWTQRWSEIRGTYFRARGRGSNGGNHEPYGGCVWL